MILADFLPPPLIITDADISVNQTFPNNYNITDADIFVMQTSPPLVIIDADISVKQTNSCANKL